MNKGILNKRVAVVSGGGRGIGREIAFTYAREGCAVILVARNKEELEKTAQEICAKTMVSVDFFAVDVSRASLVKEMVESIIKRFKKIDILVECGFNKWSDWFI